MQSKQEAIAAIKAAQYREARDILQKGVSPGFAAPQHTCCPHDYSAIKFSGAGCLLQHKMRHQAANYRICCWQIF